MVEMPMRHKNAAQGWELVYAYLAARARSDRAFLKRVEE
jgi:hypothetical protein